MPSDELLYLSCELAEDDAPRLHSLWPVFALLYRLELGTDPTPSDMYMLGCCPRHF